MKEYKIILTQWMYSNLLDTKDAYAIVASTYLIAEPGAYRGVDLSNPDSMYVIANDIQDASDQLNEYLTLNIKRKEMRVNGIV